MAQKKETVQIPASLDEAVSHLEGLGKLITAREWERAANLAAYVQPGKGQGARTSLTSEGGRISASAFAAKGIHGLRSENTVLRYVNRWLETHNGRHPKPGASVRLPTEEFTPTRTREGTGTEDGQGAPEAPKEAKLDQLRQLMSDPELAQAAIEDKQLAEQMNAARLEHYKSERDARRARWQEMMARVGEDEDEDDEDDGQTETGIRERVRERRARPEVEAFFRLSSLLVDMCEEGRTFVHLFPKLTDEDHVEAIKEQFEWLEAVFAAMQSVVGNFNQDWDDALRKLLDKDDKDGSA